MYEEGEGLQCSGVGIAAGIILFNPNIKHLYKNIEAIITQVDIVIAVDNGSGNISEIEKVIKYYENIILICNEKNKGVSAALNQIISTSLMFKKNWTLLMDQDSLCSKNLMSTYLKIIGISNVGIITCNIMDRNTRQILIIDKNNCDNKEYSFVERCITSGSLINNKICQKVGMFDEHLFIDYVDYDMCFTLREKGYKIIKCNYNGILHELGRTQVKKIFGLKFIITNHSALRRYYFSRNIVYCIKKHKKNINILKFIYKDVIRILIVLFYENNKWEKFKMGLKGNLDGIKMPLEKTHCLK